MCIYIYIYIYTFASEGDRSSRKTAWRCDPANTCDDLTSTAVAHTCLRAGAPLRESRKGMHTYIYIYIYIYVYIYVYIYICIHIVIYIYI